MRPARALDHLGDLAITALAALGLCLAVLAAAEGLRWLSANWDEACHHLLRAPTPPRFAAPWRVTSVRFDPACPSRRP